MKIVKFLGSCLGVAATSIVAGMATQVGYDVWTDIVKPRVHWNTKSERKSNVIGFKFK